MHRQLVREALDPRKGWGLALSPRMGARSLEQMIGGLVLELRGEDLIPDVGAGGMGMESSLGVIEREAADKSGC